MSDGTRRPDDPAPGEGSAASRRTRRRAGAAKAVAHRAQRPPEAKRSAGRRGRAAGTARRGEPTIPPPPIEVGEPLRHRVGFLQSIRSGWRRDPGGMARDSAVSLGSMVLWVAFTVVVFRFAMFTLRTVYPGDDPALEFGWLSESETRAAREAEAKLPVKLDIPNRVPEVSPDPEPESATADGGESEGGAPSVVEPVDTRNLFRGRERAFELLVAEGGDERTRTAISQGLAWLKRQQHEDGHWRFDDPTKYPDGSEWPTWKTHSGATALALLAFLGAGNTHLDGDYDETVKKGLEWLLAQQRRKSGADAGDFFEFYEQGREAHFFAHSLATIAVCEAYALTGDEWLREPAEKAVDFLVRAQHPVEGGWGYQPLRDEEAEAHLWVTGWGLMALFTARSAGIDVDPEEFRRSSRFVDSVMVDGGRRYRNRSHPDDPVREALVAQGLLARQYLGWPRDEPALVDAVEALLSEERRPRWVAGERNLYAWYHAAQVLHNLGGDEWRDWYAHVQNLIVEHQRTVGPRNVKGSWDPFEPSGAPHELADKMGRLYATATCLLILETPFRHMPVYATSGE